MADIGFNTSDAEDVQTSFEPLPNGSYAVIIKDSDRPTSQAGHEYIKLVFAVVDGPHTNRLVFDNLSVYHPDPKVKGIAQSNLKAITEALGILNPSKTEQLHNIPMMIELRVKKQGNGQMGNNIVAYRRIGDAPQQSAPQQTASDPANSPAPWAKS